MIKRDLRLENNYKCIIEHVGLISILIGLITFLPLICLIFYPEERIYAISFIAPGILTLLFGLTLKFLFTRKYQSNLTINQDAIIVIIGWLVAITTGAIPFYLGNQLGVHQSFFESFSGYSTCGLTMYRNLSDVPHIFLLHRSITQLFGGMGFVLVITSFLPISFGTKLYSTEGHSDRVLPSVKRTGKMVLSVYSMYILVGTIFYALGNMDIFEGLNHAIAAIVTGGFGTENLSIGAFNSPYIEGVSIVLMILGSTHFFTHYLVLTGKGKNIFKVGELRFFALLMLIFIPFLAFYIPISENDPIRKSIFSFISAITTTGFSTISFDSFPSTAIFIMIIAMLIGGGSGSTSGGIKYSRVYLLFKNLVWNFKDLFKSHHTVNEKFIVYPNGKKGIISQLYMNSIYNFTFLYMVTIALGVFGLTAFGFPLKESLFEFSSALSGTGLSIGITSPDMGTGPIWILNIGMFIGRLEIVVIVIAILRIVNDGFNALTHKFSKRN